MVPEIHPPLGGQGGYTWARWQQLQGQVAIPGFTWAITVWHGREIRLEGWQIWWTCALNLTNGRFSLTNIWLIAQSNATFFIIFASY